MMVMRAHRYLEGAYDDNDVVFNLVFICACISEVIFVKNANFDFGTLFIVPSTTILLL